MISYIVHNYVMPAFPPPDVIAAMREWCRTHRGSVQQIADSVVQHDGTIGINHSAVSRTIAGREHNSSVYTAYRKLRASLRLKPNQN